jgi:hypothetical protein
MKRPEGSLKAIALVLALGATLFFMLGPAGLAHLEEKAAKPNGLLLAMSEGSWVAFGGDAQVRFTPDAAHVKTGRSALALDYKVEPRQFAAAVLPVGEGSLAGMKSMRFRLKTDSATPVAVLLSEKKPGGGNYVSILWSPRDTWQKIELTPDDFALSDGPNDPKDPDGKLDLDQVEGVGIADLAPLFSAMPENPELPIVVEKRSGAHTLFVDEFEARADGGEASPPAASKTVVIDDFHRGYLQWFTLGGVELSLSLSSNPLSGHALEARYEQAEGHYVVLMHPLANTNLGKVDRLEFDIASEKDAQIVLSVETKKSSSGKSPRYNTTVEVPGKRKPVHPTVLFADFKPDENGPPDPEGRLDTSRIKSIGLLDITSAMSHENQKNTLWIANLRAEGAQGGQSGQPARESKPQTQHTHDMSAMSTPMGHDAHEMPIAISHNENAHVTESMSSNHMHMGPHMKLTDPRASAPGDQMRADEIVKTLRESLQKYTDYHVAIKGGYLPYLPNIPQPQYHFTNNGYGYLEAFRFDPAHPTSLLYKKTSDGYQLLGAMYTAPYAASEDNLNARVPLSVARWHLHTNICLPQGGMAKISDWTRFGPGGSISTEQACTQASGKFTPHLFGWMVHVYPFEDKPENIWAH